MKYFGLILIPLLVALFIGAPGCTQSQDEPAVKMEKVPEKAAEAPAPEEAGEVVVEEDEVVVEVEEPAEPGEEAGEEIEKIEVE